MTKKQLVCCFTGHRKLEKFEEEAANNILDKLLDKAKETAKRCN